MTAGLLPEETDERASTEAAVAMGLAELSSADVVPTEVTETTPFEADDVDFRTNGWVSYLIRVKDWLRLSNDIDATAEIPDAVAQLFADLGHTNQTTAFGVTDSAVVLSEIGLELLRDRIDRALELKDRFEANLDHNTPEAATGLWIESWDETVEETISGPITATAATWGINDFAGRARKHRLELSPSYQRGDVWPTKDSQLLIESIVRGIPLPSIIILKPSGETDTPYEVVDGKQRLTAILRFIGAHPQALEYVKAKDQEFPAANLSTLFATNYPQFRKAWKNATGETLTSTREKELFFPFKLSSNSQALTGDLAKLRGKYYHQVADCLVKVGGDTIDISDLFTQTTSYKIPIIEYTDATPRQIHEVFKLYNKQGKHLNAEEIRNAVYHELDLMRALAVASGDNPDLVGSAGFLVPVESEVAAIAVNLEEYRIGDTRYRRTKVLSWLVSVLASNCSTSEGTPRLLSTAGQINALLDRVQESPNDPLRNDTTICRLLVTVSTAMQAHAEADAWAPKFRDNNNGVRWQELQLVASLLGVAIATAVKGPEISDLLITHESALMQASRSSEWKRPQKTQTKRQWEYIAMIALAILDILDIDQAEASVRLNQAFGTSCIQALTSIAR